MFGANVVKMSYRSARWYFNCPKWNPTESEILLASSCVQVEEKERLMRFLFRDDFKSSLIGRLMMRKFISDLTNINYDKVRFGRDPRGKPFLLGGVSPVCDNISFNVSHQGDYVVFAGELNVPQIGVDVMKLNYSGGKPTSEFFRIMHRQFTDNEWIKIKSSGSEKRQIDTFCRLWSLKESYVKAIGVGINVNLRDIDFRINTNQLSRDILVDSTELFVKSEKANWLFEETLIDDYHCVSVALNKNFTGARDENVKFQEMGFEELTKGAVPLLEKDYQYVKDFIKKNYK